MNRLFKADKYETEVEPKKLLTRFKRVHRRDAPQPPRDGGIDPLGTLTRADQQHQRATPTPNPTSGPSPVRRSMMDLQAALHANGPISVSVLQNALPLRTAKIAGKSLI
ncbi:hypothetical protein Q4555_10800 [Octadecabacter sp. 1_MG-2023]|uniref:hypothetical protein n=1 Tax=unclassified Octadecabacter TaxID=196158 RepID=UPI001C09BFBB|nr:MULTISPECIES: hypothetical protein [unclassified Octadecabacter]MBU2992081.1 hypothetical protein [Octadecabacter sp. B2R22]MDO6735162.1 hypothetical protein [Octadecabacter sp. 1_MG-2023]